MEMHMFLGCLKKGANLQGYYDKKLVRTNLIKKRHDHLALEMRARGMQHHSPMPQMHFFQDSSNGAIDLQANVEELKRRCPKCRKRIMGQAKNNLQ